MYKTVELLDKVKAKYDLPSDYALAKKIELTRSYVSRLRQGKHFPSTENAYKLAQLLMLNPLQVVVSCEYERAKHFGDETMINFWKKTWEDIT